MDEKWKRSAREQAVHKLCITLSKYVHQCADEIFDSYKPSDLHFPIIRLLGLVKHLIELRYFWLEKVQGLHPNDRGQFPHL